MQVQARQERVYRFPLETGAPIDDVNLNRLTVDPNNRGQPLTSTGYMVAIGAPLLTFILIAIFGALAGMDTLTTVCPTCVTALWFMTLGFYILYDLPWYALVERNINAMYYKHHGTDKILNGGPGRTTLMLVFFPLAATSNLFLVILPSIEHPGRHFSYYVTCFRALVNGVWCYGTLGVIQGITFPRFPLELAGLVFLSGSLLSMFTSLSVVAIAETFIVVNSTQTGV